MLTCKMADWAWLMTKIHGEGFKNPYNLKRVYCMFLLLSALVSKNLNYAQVISNDTKICDKPIEHSVDLYKLNQTTAQTSHGLVWHQRF